MKIWRWTDTKNSVKMIEVNAEDQYKTGWTKEPGFMTVLKKDFKLRVFAKWKNLTDDQTRKIYNHEIKWTTDTAGKLDVDHTHYIFFEKKGYFEIRFDDRYCKFTLSFISNDDTKYHLAENPDNMGNIKAIKWLKHFAQYLIDEPDDLNVMICKQIPIAPYINIPFNEVLCNA
jgi:hypothetical protein